MAVYTDVSGEDVDGFLAQYALGEALSCVGIAEGIENSNFALTTTSGEIIAKGPNIMKGYWGNPEATAEAIDKDGWYHTGDVGRFENGFLVITDRIKHMLVSAGGKNIYPGPIEEGFKHEPWIDQIMIVGEAREFLTALVVPDEGVIRSYAKEQGLAASSLADILATEEVQRVFQQLFRSYSRSAAAHEKVRDFRLVLEPFSVDNGMMTPTMKLKRKVIGERYADLIEEMYAGVIGRASRLHNQLFVPQTRNAEPDRSAGI